MSQTVNTTNKHTEKKVHPYQIIMFFLLFALSSIFAIFTISQLVTNIGKSFPDFKIPLIFHANTIIILLCSYVIHQAKNAFENENEIDYKRAISITFGLGWTFLILQSIGFWELFNSGITVSNNLNGSYLYIISAAHALHVIAGLIPLGITLYNIRQRKKNLIKSVVFSSDPVNKVKVRLLAVYWHFVDALWLYLYLFFWLIILLF
ncbi:MAG: hypothetical protein HKN92_11425 [Chitinophagales bacterium]|nr:hypothetical protein [Chitinophagales bacterium]